MISKTKKIFNLVKSKYSFNIKYFSNSKSSKDTDNTANSSQSSDKSSPPESKLDLDENTGKEFNRKEHDPTDKTKPYDNYESMIYHPEIREQMEKRKDIFHTLDTPYLIKEKKEKEENKENKK
jgi:hypothetical protein